MSDDHLTIAELADYHAGRVSGKARLVASRHLAECEPCRAALLRLQKFKARVGDEEEVTDERIAARPHFNADDVLSGVKSSGAPRWMLPLVVGVSLGVGFLWWSFTLRQLDAPTITLRDGGGTITFAANGRSLALREVPALIQDVLAETLRTGRVAIAPDATERAGQRAVLSEGKRAELEQWTSSARGSHLVMGVAYARAGLIDDALREFRSLAQQNPESSLARQLLEQVETRAR